MALIGAPVDQREKLIFVEAFEGDGVDLDLHPGGLRGLDAVEHLGQAAPAGDFSKFRRVQRVERDVDALDPALGEFGGVFRQLAAVGGQREFFQRTRGKVPRHGAEEGHDALADKWFAACDPQLLHPGCDEGRAQPVKLFQRQEVGLGQEGHVFGHAIGAAEIAAVGDRNAQIADRAGERVDKGGQGRAHR